MYNLKCDFFLLLLYFLDLISKMFFFRVLLFGMLEP